MYYWLDKDNSVLCEWCAEDSKDHFIEHFRPVSGPHLTGREPVDCDECGEVIEASESSE